MTVSQLCAVTYGLAFWSMTSAVIISAESYFLKAPGFPRRAFQLSLIFSLIGCGLSIASVLPWLEVALNAASALLAVRVLYHQWKKSRSRAAASQLLEQ